MVREKHEFVHARGDADYSNFDATCDMLPKWADNLI